jgi:hypothetical protein
MKSRMTSDEFFPEKLFADSLYTVPDYQRGYSWREKQWDDLLEDLDLLEENKIHYTGTLVLHDRSDRETKRDKQGTSYSQFDIVDGQQRLTTVVLFLDAIRREFLELEKPDLAQGIFTRYVAVQDRNGELMPKLRLNRDSHEFFFNSVLLDNTAVKGPTLRSHQNLKDAKSYFAAYLRGQRDARKDKYLDWLLETRDKVAQHLALTVHTVGDTADVGVIFEVMNNRGLPISELEKVKNYLLYVSTKLALRDTSDFAEQVNERWTRMLEELMSAGLGTIEQEERLLRAFWILAYDADSRRWQGSNSVKERFHLRDYKGQHQKLLKDLRGYVGELEQAAVAFSDIMNPGRDGAYGDYKENDVARTQIRHAGEKLVRMRLVAPFLPLLMAVRLRFPNRSADYLTALDLCEKYAFRVYRFLERRSNTGLSWLYWYGYAVYNRKESFVQIMDELRGAILHYSPNSSIDNDSVLLTDEGNDWYSWAGLKYFLYEYEEHLANGRPIRVPWSDVEGPNARENTIEHILPQTPDDRYWKAKFSLQQRRRLMDDIGNLCLTYDNSSYSNKPFPDKRGHAGSEIPCYAMSSLFQERELAKQRVWSPRKLVERRNSLLAWARNRWHVDAPERDVNIGYEDDEGNENGSDE